MENSSICTNIFIVVVTLALVSDTLGLVCYESVPDGEIAKISCSGSCQVTVWRGSGHTVYKCNQSVHSSGCTPDKKKRDCFCNTNLCNRFGGTNTGLRFKPVPYGYVLDEMNLRKVADDMTNF